ncbi:MAG: hypothetical protein NTW21_40815 [Verrucomicrobia bacterium]|nr:hypothetical protein [Verrucomicrobiota bacterium]
MKGSSRILSAAILLGAAVLVSVKFTSSGPAVVGLVPAETPATAPPRVTVAEPADSALVSQGQLWETVATSARARASTTMPVTATAFQEAQSGPVGSHFSIVLSPQFPVLAAEVTNRSVADDGTIITHLRISGKVPGSLTLQENSASGFFLGQLYYDGLTVAYEFRPAGEGLSATRHELGDLICAIVDAKGCCIETLGLPPVDEVKVKKAKAEEQNLKAVGPSQEGKAVTPASPASGTTGSALSINDVASVEGNPGLTNLVFTVKLSKADSTRIITVKYATADGTAMAGADYLAVSGTVTFPKGSTTQTVTVAIVGDAVLEADETFTLNLSSPVNATIADASGLGTIINDDLTPSNVPVHNSLPGAVAVVYLDMDGQVVSGSPWAGGATLIARGISTSCTQAQMSEIWRRTAEDYAPFQINVTTQESVYLAAAPNRRIRCIITPDNEWYGAVGGVAYVNSFTWTGDTPCWVFSDQLANTPRYIAEACSHECGHTLGLSHDGRISPVEAYYAGQGTGEVGWGPIMGVGYYKTLVQWSKGEYLSANNAQDDLAIITSQNGFSYRVDQVANTAAGATALTLSDHAAAASGIIETRSDVDVFSFTTGGGTVTFDVLGDATSQNLDILAEIRDASGNLLAASNPDLLTDASLSISLSAGTYFLHVSGVGRGDYLVDGYTDYSSIGQYTISGTVP